ncbi:hypothetical protein CF8_0146 [Aeromonas phage CF8]|nr:hypothetical protein CF8_0146 [Aeromonas phage CF8]
MNTSQHLLKEILARKTVHPITEIHNYMNQNDDKTKAVCLALYEQLKELNQTKVQNKLSIVFSEDPKHKLGKHIDLVLESLCVDPISEKEYFTLSSELPAYKDRLNRVKFDYALLTPLCKLELNLEL